jgi:hypothetical protein
VCTTLFILYSGFLGSSESKIFRSGLFVSGSVAASMTWDLLFRDASSLKCCAISGPSFLTQKKWHSAMSASALVLSRPVRTELVESGNPFDSDVVLFCIFRGFAVRNVSSQGV